MNRNKSIQPTFKYYGFTMHKVIKVVDARTQKEVVYQSKVNPVKSPTKSKDYSLQCKGCFKRDFLNLCGLRGHEATCRLAIEVTNDDELKKRLLAKEKNLAHGHFRQSSTTQSERNNINYNDETCTLTATATSAETMTIILDEDDQALGNTKNKCDGRKRNIGSSTRMRYNSITKYKHIVACEEFMDEQRRNGQTPSVTIFVRATYSENRQRN